MTSTFAALLFAHALADFIFQSARMSEGKRDREILPFVAHMTVVAATAAIALGTSTGPTALPVLFLTLAHFAIDLAKTFTPHRKLWPFLLDQTLHLVSLAAIALICPALWADGFWAGALWTDTGWGSRLWAASEQPLAWLPTAMAFGAGLILTTRAGGFAVGLLMEPWAGHDLPTGLANGGKLIGWMERGLIFLLVIVGQPAGIGFLIAAKSILRFETTSQDQRAGEYIIIGTLASFGWALILTYATVMLIAALPPLGILPPTP
jgi:Protein of unknown function (DUF3307)